jgi:hypothetical protein
MGKPKAFVDDWLLRGIDVLTAAGCGPVVVVHGAALREARALLHRQDVDAGRPVAVATIVEDPDTAVVGRRLVVRPPRPNMMLQPELPTAGSSASQPRRIVDVPRPTRVACSTLGAASASAMARRGSGAGRACAPSCSLSPLRRACSCAAPSTTPRLSRGSAASSAIGSRSATPDRCSRPPTGSPTPPRWWSIGRTGTGSGRSRLAPRLENCGLRAHS